jgi:hypothetical protein
MNLSGESITPDNTIRNIQNLCTSHILNLSYEHGASTITNFLSYSVKVIYGALTGNQLDVQGQEHTRDQSVITDHSFSVGDRIEILWEDKSSKVFDRYIGKIRLY